ncbi:hypothetical protein OZ410_14145 [Robiginitalea sp. M366]|uniref:hypothetical protein n=1 Tax=Robiginitalea aestuariiviva TaxID=3036903 RepID=UPI00240E93C7|nr:hypothetical protein [Robiginitalea aestuariiviva]MDG1573467.1 hypothetical protein [Robiginitalea aestuariiviva]
MKAKKGHSGFRVPEGYFRDLPGRLEQQLQAEGDSLPADDGFSVPEGYFDAFADRLEARMRRPKGRVRNLWAVSGWVAAAAAAVVLLLVLRPTGGQGSPAFEDLAGFEIEAYLDGYDEMSTYELAEALPLEDIALDAVMESGPGEEQILDYLDQNMESDDAIFWNDED